MKQLTIIITVLFFAFHTQAQNIKHPNENADTLKHNSIGINISPFLAAVLSGTPQDIPSASVLYKRYGNRFNYRIGLTVLPEFSSINGESHYENGELISKNIYLHDGEIVKITDTTVMKRFDYHNSYLLSLKTGLEKTKKTKIGTWIIGADFNIAYYKKDETYLFREAVKSDTMNFDRYYTEYKFLAPNTQAPYSRGNYLKLGINFVTGFEWKVTKHLNISAEVNPYIGMLTKLSDEEYYDNDNYLQKTQTNLLDFDMGFINVIASLKF